MQYLLAFLEGVITFISPCLLPMLPIYISYFATDDGRKSKTIVNSLGFVLGFTTVFIILGAFAGTIGRFLFDYSEIVNIVAGLIVIFFGLSFLGIFKLSFLSIKHDSNRNTALRNNGFISSFIFGLVFSISWTPCVGAFLGSALALASQQGSAVKGVIMLLMYSLGLGIPFVASAVIIDRLKSTFDFIKRNYKIINAISGVFLIVIGILMMTGYLNYFLSFLTY